MWNIEEWKRKQEWECWLQRAAELHALLEDVKENTDSEALAVLLRGALDVCERRLAGHQKMERDRINRVFDALFNQVDGITTWRDREKPQ